MKEKIDLKTVYEKMQENMNNDSLAAGIFEHSGCTGDAREEFLRAFLRQRLPQKYGIGKGKIISSLCDRQSKQVDIVIYDKENCPVLYSEGGNAVYPIECVYGTIEVKSALSKEKLREGVDNILSVKQLLVAGGMRMERSMPFGIVFGFDLANNSLESLEENVREFEKEIEPEYWANMIVVLNKGIIHHINYNGFHNVYSSDEMRAEFGTIAMHWEEECLFQFYITLHDMLVDTELGKVYLSDYKKLPSEVGRHIVSGDYRVKDSEGRERRLSEQFVANVYDWCKAMGATTRREQYAHMFGQVPQGMDDEQMAQMMYLYNPDNLPPMPSNFEEVIEMENGTYRTKGDFLVPTWELMIDGELYCIPLFYIARDGFC